MIVASHTAHHSLHPERLRAIALGRRISVSPPLARALTDLVYGPDRRSDVLMLSVTTAARVSSYTEVRR